MSSVVMSSLPKWWDIYQDDAECRVFKVLSRDPDYEWRTTEAIAKKTGLTNKQVESIIAKYHTAGIILQHKTDPNKWQYWELSKPVEKKGILTEENQKKRIGDAQVAKTP